MGEDLCFTSRSPAATTKILSSGEGSIFSLPCRVMLPAGLDNFNKTKWQRGGGFLPGVAAPLTTPDEATVVTCLVEELSDRLALHLDIPCLNREIMPAAVKTGLHFLVVGSSHADRTAAGLSRTGASVSKLIVPAWRAMKSKVTAMADSIKKQLEGEPSNTVVVLQFLDTSLFIARTEEGGLVPAWKGLDGAYHVDGDSVLVPKELQYNTFQLILPIFEAVGDRKMIIVTPIPRYLLQRCCSDPEYVPNLASEDYRKLLEDAVFDCRKNFKDFAFSKGLRNVKVLGPWNAIRRLRDSAWATDPIHPEPVAYNCITGSILEMVNNPTNTAATVVNRGPLSSGWCGKAATRWHNRLAPYSRPARVVSAIRSSRLYIV